jgi:hypothetical protein
MIKNNGSEKIKLTKRKNIEQPIENNLTEPLGNSNNKSDEYEQPKIKLDKKKKEISLNKKEEIKPEENKIKKEFKANPDDKINSCLTLEAFCIFVMIVFFIFYALDVKNEDLGPKLGTISDCTPWKPILKDVPNAEKFEQSQVCGDVTDGKLVNKKTNVRNAIGKGDAKPIFKKIDKVKLSSSSYHICSPWLPKPNSIEKEMSFTQNQVCGDMDRGKLLNQKRDFRNAIGIMKKAVIETVTYGPWIGDSPNNNDVNTTVVQRREKSKYINGKLSNKTHEIRKFKGTNPVIKKNNKKPIKKVVNNKYRNITVEFMLISALRVNLLKIKESKGLNNYKFVHPGFIHLISGLSEFAKSTNSYNLSSLYDAYTVSLIPKRRRDCQKFMNEAYKLEGIYSVVVNSTENLIVKNKKYYVCRDGRNKIIAVFK